jgi:hypothetical protein
MSTAASPPDSATPQGQLPEGRLPERRIADLRLIFGQLYSEFRRTVHECYEHKSVEILSRAEETVRSAVPGFDHRALADESAPSVLDLVGEVVDRASYFKRRRLRRAATALIADLYSKHYDLLEQRGLIERIEESYYRLRS